MSFRCPFVTDFIYWGQTPEELEKLTETFKRFYGHTSHTPDERGYGFYAGFVKNLDSSINDTGVEEIARELEKATPVEFRITFLLESGPQVTYLIKPRT